MFGGFVDNYGDEVFAMSDSQTENVGVVETGTGVEVVEHDVMGQWEH